ncbi:acyltransferase [Pedobacter sp. MC2016-24]|uniref:acyltransferase n=1 Tax=Pedobacter sp. MC2016-24 TaxID=2780090 RepID=UPI0018806553|nr:acyltransferase [Pedobacter sp. MC2016-24]MBE9600311.1 acyltransferase [Pedobacter sp. MC2016-24]
MINFWVILDRIKEKLLSVYRKGVFLGRIKGANDCVKVLGKVYVNATNITIGKNVTIYPGVYFWGDGEIVIGDNVDIGIGTIIFSKKSVRIGNNSNIAAHCYIIDSNHGIKKDQLITSQMLSVDNEGIYIGDDVWVAAGCKVLKGSKINNGAVIGAMSLVNSEIEAYGIAIGTPAKVIKFRN